MFSPAKNNYFLAKTHQELSDVWTSLLPGERKSCTAHALGEIGAQYELRLGGSGESIRTSFKGTPSEGGSHRRIQDCSARWRFLARGSPAKTYDAGIDQRTVLVEFDSLAQAIATHDSPGYQAALAVLSNAAERDMRVVEGVDD